MDALLTVKRIPRVRELNIPKSYFLGAHKPAPLAESLQSSPETARKVMYLLGLRKLVCLTEDHPDYVSEQLNVAGHFPLQDLYNGIGPLATEHEVELVWRSTGLVTSLLKQRIGVVVHCTGGTGRTGTVIGCTLKGLGYNSTDILVYLDQHNRVRGARCGWPESRWQAEMIRSYPNSPSCHFG